MDYNFREIEQKWQSYWKQQNTYEVHNDDSKPKFYVLDMFPYPSGAGLHVGHPLGYIASDIYSRFKKMQGFNVLHPMGFDAFGLPAEQYALETGQHPAKTTEQNIARYKEQLANIGFNYDWSREIRTSDPQYYQWTQWIFLQLFESWFDKERQKARPISDLIKIFAEDGNKGHLSNTDHQELFDAAAWQAMSEAEQRNILMNYRLAYLDYADVWWCTALNTVLANDEVVNGVSERGGHPVEKKKLKQWFLRITNYAERLLESLDSLDWSDAMKEMQRNWIGKSVGAEVRFAIENSEEAIKVFTTRPDTIFGVDFMVLAPELDLVSKITSAEKKAEVAAYQTMVKSRSEIERMAEKRITGAFTGAYATHPLSGKSIPIWISEYVLAGYGTGAIMAVPSGDERDFAFAKHFKLPITNIFGERFTGEAALTDKNALIENSDFLSGKTVKDATALVLAALQKSGKGSPKVNYKLRDAGFSRQRYWGEPFPIVYDGETPYAITDPSLNLTDEQRQLPVALPHVASYGPGPEGEGPLANLEDWMYIKQGDKTYRRETNTMPGYAGSSWYFLRYMDPKNDMRFVGKEASDYWQQVDLYVGGTEHAVGHLLYSRLWTKVLADLGYLSFDEPFKRLVNQGMIQGSSRFVYREAGTNHFISKGLIKNRNVATLHVDVSLVDGVHLDIDAFRKWREDFAQATFELEDGHYVCGVEVEKMSKSKYNVINPDEIVAQFGADTFRMYEMFLGPLEVSKPWDTKGIEGVHRFLKKFWRLFYGETDKLSLSEESATVPELKALHKSIKKIKEDTERFSFNTAVAQFMILTNELHELKCQKRAILEPALQLLAPYAPHIAEELWSLLGHKESITHSVQPVHDDALLQESSKMYPIAINGKHRANMEFPIDADQSIIEEAVLKNDIVAKWLEGKTPKKIIFVKGKMINIVL